MLWPPIPSNPSRMKTKGIELGVIFKQIKEMFWNCGEFDSDYFLQAVKCDFPYVGTIQHHLGMS